MAATANGESDLWLFGYGSLIWKPPPRFDKRVPGYIEGYVRRFWQASEDHRGTPAAPGRVVTLVPRVHWEKLTDQFAQAPPRVWGTAYRIPAQYVREVKEQLDIREINGYSIDMAPVHIPVHIPDATDNSKIPTSSTGDPAPITSLVYVGLPTNPQFIGPQDPDALARHIVRSRGPSGENKEYVYQLADSLEALRKEIGSAWSEDDLDEHVHDLAQRVRKAEQELDGQ